MAMCLASYLSVNSGCSLSDNERTLPEYCVHFFLDMVMYIVAAMGSLAFEHSGESHWGFGRCDATLVGATSTS